MNERGRPRHAGNGTQTWSAGNPDHGSGQGGEFAGPAMGWSHEAWAPYGAPVGGSMSAGGASGAGADWEPTDWFTPVGQGQRTAVGVLDRPATQQPAPAMQAAPTLQGLQPASAQLPDMTPAEAGFTTGTLEITPQDVYAAVGQDAAEDMLATAEINVDQLIRLLNEETTVLPPLAIPDDIAELDDGSGEPPQEVTEAVGVWKQRFLKGAIAAVIVSLTGGAGAASAMDKSVKLDVDGHESTVSTYDNTVGEVLQEEGIQVGPHDALSPSPQAHVGHGDSIKIDRGRLLKVTVDGQEREQWVRSETVGQALSQMGIDDKGAKISADRNQPIPEKGMQLTVNTQKSVKLIDGGGQPRDVTTTAATVGELVQEQHVNVGPQDQVSPDKNEKLTSGMTVSVNRNGSQVINTPQPVPPPEQEIPDPTLFQGEDQVEVQGNPGEKLVFLRVTQKNGEEVGRTPVGEKVTKQPTPTVKRVGTKPRPDDEIWDKLVQCEGGGNWNTDSGNGYYGGLQFDKKTWDANGGSQFAPYPNQASREQQIAIATKIRDQRGGYGAWPSCSKKLNLD